VGEETNGEGKEKSRLEGGDKLLNNEAESQCILSVHGVGWGGGDQ